MNRMYLVTVDEFGDGVETMRLFKSMQEMASFIAGLEKGVEWESLEFLDDRVVHRSSEGERKYVLKVGDVSFSFLTRLGAFIYASDGGK